MSTIRDGPDGVDAAVHALRQGGLVVLPTDTVYGLAVRADLAGAGSALARAKDRPALQAVAVLVTDRAEAEGVARFDPRAAAVAEEFWPGPVTLVVERQPGNDWDLGEPEATVGVRVPDHRFVREVARLVGPLAVTSANRHGDPTPARAEGAAAALSVPVDVIVDGGVCAGLASTVVDLVGPSAAVLRVGAVSEQRLRGALDRL